MFAERSHRLSGTAMGARCHRARLLAPPDRAPVDWLRQLGWWALGIVVIQGLIGGKPRAARCQPEVPGFDMSLGQMLRVPHGVLAQRLACALVRHRRSAVPAGWVERRPVPVAARPARTAAVACVALVSVPARRRRLSCVTAIAGIGHPHVSLLRGRWHALLPSALGLPGRPYISPTACMAVGARGRDPDSRVRLQALVDPRRDSLAHALRRIGLLVSLLGCPDPTSAPLIIWSQRSARDLTTGHVLVGAATLATTFGLACLAHRDVDRSQAPPLHDHDRRTLLVAAPPAKIL